MYKISAVSYANSYPFIFGLRNNDVINQVQLALDNPADCARKLVNGEVDLGLVPVAIIPQMPEFHIVSKFCIGADGPVESVCLFSDVPLNEIDTILLDYQSRTSVQLVQYLAERVWNINPSWVSAEEGFESSIGSRTAGVVIGDRAFPLLKKFKYVYDLSEEWKKSTELPFVFACWVSNKELDNTFIKSFEEALKFGLDHKRTAIESMALTQHEDLVRYVDSVIHYDLDEKKREAMELFLDWMSKAK